MAVVASSVSSVPILNLSVALWYKRLLTLPSLQQAHNMDDASSLGQWPAMSDLTLNQSAEDSDTDKDSSESQETLRESHENNRQAEQSSPEEKELPWEDDPANAHNWSKPSRYFHSVVPCE